jgi:hypothetical protein
MVVETRAPGEPLKLVSYPMLLPFPRYVNNFTGIILNSILQGLPSFSIDPQMYLPRGMYFSVHYLPALTQQLVTTSKGCDNTR